MAITDLINKWRKELADKWLHNYFQTFSQKHLSLFFITTTAIAIFFIPIKKLLLSFIEPIFGDLPNNDTLRSFFILVLLIISIGYSGNHLRHKRIPTIDSFITIFSVSFVYFYLFRSDKSFYYFKFFSTEIYLLDLIWASSIFFIADYQLIAIPLKLENSYLLEDNPYQTTLNDDLLNRNSFSETIAKIINNTTPDKAIAIAILSKWGFGKTVFLRQLENELKKDNSTNIIITFNPWKSDSNVNVLQVFFEELSDKLSKFNHSTTKQLKDYAQKLSYNEDSDSPVIKLSKSLLGGLFFDQPSITKQHNELNKSIQRIGKRVVVLIDDLDRLSGDELAPIMRLIRNVADFQNVIFVAAFDRSYVTNALFKTEKLTNEEKYLEKIFQLEVPLPPIEKTLIKQELLRLFRPNLPVEDTNPETIEFINIINEIAYEKNNYFENLLLNLRDVKRFINSFKTTYNLTKGEVVLRDIFLLELIKYKSLPIYEELANQNLLEDIQTGNNLEQRKLKKEVFEKVNITDNILKDEIHLLLNMLFPGNSNSDTDSTLLLNELGKFETNPLCIRFKRNHLSYFSYISGNLVSKYLSKRSEGFSDLKQFIDQLSTDTNSKINNLNDYFDIAKFALYNEKLNNNWLKNTLKSLIYLSKYISWKDKIKDHFEDYIKKPNLYLNSAFNNNQDDFNTFIINEVLLEEEFGSQIRSDITLYLIRSHIYGNKPIIGNLQNLIDLNLSLFNEYKTGFPLDEEGIYGLLLQNWSDIEMSSKKVILNPIACFTYKNYLKKKYCWFVKNLIRPYAYPERAWQEYTFDPFIEQIFDSYSEFESFLNSLPENDCINYNKQKYSEFRANGYKPIIIEDFRTASPCLTNE